MRLNRNGCGLKSSGALWCTCLARWNPFITTLESEPEPDEDGRPGSTEFLVMPFPRLPPSLHMPPQFSQFTSLATWKAGAFPTNSTGTHPARQGFGDVLALVREADAWGANTRPRSNPGTVLQSNACWLHVRDPVRRREHASAAPASHTNKLASRFSRCASLQNEQGLDSLQPSDYGPWRATGQPPTPSPAR